MKKITLIFLILLFTPKSLFAQAPIDVLISGECLDASGTYTYNGLVNGKNNYVRTVVIDGETFTAAVGFDNTKWVLYAEGDLTDTGYINIAVPTGLMPPFTGWTRTGCVDGTMIINQALSAAVFTDFEKSLSLYPNPSADYIVIECATNQSDALDFQIIDLTGRTISRGQSRPNDKINIQSLQTGNYVLVATNQNGASANKRFAKN